MSNAIVSNVYRYVIDDVINQVRGDFEDMGIDESILQELQRSWESKIARSRVANFGFKDDEYYEDERGTNMNTILRDGQLHYPSEYSNNGHPNTGHSPATNLANLAAQGIHNNRLLPQMQPPYGIPPINGHNRAIQDQNPLSSQYQMMQNQQNNNNSNTLPELQLPRPNIPQNDGANDMTTQEIDRHIEDIIQSSSQEDQIVFTASSFSGEPLALESLPEHVKQLMKDARGRAIKAGALSKNYCIPQLDGSDDIKEEETDEQPEKNDDDINSDLDDTDEDGEDGEGGEEIEHIILCLYDKVSRTKNKWKCTLKDGIMLINGRDYLFARANGDFEW